MRTIKIETNGMNFHEIERILTSQTTTTVLNRALKGGREVQISGFTFKGRNGRINGHTTVTAAVNWFRLHGGPRKRVYANCKWVYNPYVTDVVQKCTTKESYIPQDQDRPAWPLLREIQEPSGDKWVVVTINPTTQRTETHLCAKGEYPVTGDEWLVSQILQ